MSESDFDYGGRGVSCFARPAYSPLDRDKGGALDRRKRQSHFPPFFLENIQIPDVRFFFVKIPQVFLPYLCYNTGKSGKDG